MSERGINDAIENLEDAFKLIEYSRDQITLPQYRRLKTLHHKFANLLVVAVRADEAVPKESRETE